MPITLNVQAYRGIAPQPPLARRFERSGGVIGRGAGSDLVLDDPTKYISRAHARVEWRDDGWFLVDLGSNPTLVDGRALGAAGEIRLAGGERIDIGDYTLAATLEPEPAAPAPRPEPLLMPAAASAAAPAPISAPVPAMAYGQGIDTLAEASILHLGGVSAGGFDPAADPLGINLAPAAARAPGPAWRGAESDHAPPEQAAFVMPVPAGLPMAVIPDGYDPLADLLPAATPRQAAGPAAAAPAPAAPAWEMPDAPAGLQGRPASHGHTVLQAQSPPQSQPEPQSQPQGAQPHAQAQAQPQPQPQAQPRSQPEPQPEPVQVARPQPVPVPLPQAVPVAQPQPVPSLEPVPVPVPRATALPAGAAAPAAADDSRVVRALLRGLGLPDLHSRLGAEELAELAGAMLREATAGTIGALMARALTKRESRVEMTMIAPQANNPLKFFPDAATALTHMLQGSMPGYVAPEQAFAGAFVDLRAHELAVMAGTRAALAGVLRRFDPKALEDRLQEPGMLDKVFTSGRKTKLWDRMVDLYDQLALEADEDFQRLFGAAFAVAYEEQVRRLREAGL